MVHPAHASLIAGLKLSAVTGPTPGIAMNRRHSASRKRQLHGQLVQH
jgi:hypothetical protein